MAVRGMKRMLGAVKKTVSGSKTVLVQRIISFISIDEAVKVVQEYRTWIDIKERPDDMDVDVNEDTKVDDTIMEKEDNEEETKLTLEEEETVQKMVNKRLCNHKRSLEKVSIDRDNATPRIDRGTKETELADSSGASDSSVDSEESDSSSDQSSAD